jgi:hypothetical protein
MQSVILEVGVGLALLFYVTATLVSGVAEGVTRLTNTRSKMLWAALARLVSDDHSTAPQTLGAPFLFKSVIKIGDVRPDYQPTPPAVPAPAAVMAGADPVPAEPEPAEPEPAERQSASKTKASKSPLTKARLAELAATPSVRGTDYVNANQTKVSNLPGTVFAAALLELATIKSQGGSVEANLAELADAYAGSPLGGYLSTVVRKAGTDIYSVTDQIAAWFDAQMVRVSQTYRKNIKWFLAVLGLVVALVCNIDTLHVAQALRTSADLREVVAATAGQIKPNTECDAIIPADEPAVKILKCGLEDLESFNALGVVVPFSDKWTDRLGAAWTGAQQTNVWSHALGIGITTGAVALGGPMWFDFLMLLTGRKKNG